MKLHRFMLPRGGDFAIPTDWWIASGMDRFQRKAESYCFAPSSNVLLVLLEDIAPMKMDERQHLDYGGFSAKRMTRVLQGIASHNEMPPIEITERHHGPYRYVIGGATGLGGGVHRFYASVAAGYSSIPCVLSWLPDDVLDRLTANR